MQGMNLLGTNKNNRLGYIAPNPSRKVSRIVYIRGSTDRECN